MLPFTRKLPGRNWPANWSVAPSENRLANWSATPSNNWLANWSAALRENWLMNWSVTEFNEKPAADNKTRRRTYWKAN